MSGKDQVIGALIIHGIKEIGFDASTDVRVLKVGWRIEGYQPVDSQ